MCSRIFNKISLSECGVMTGLYVDAYSFRHRSVGPHAWLNL